MFLEKEEKGGAMLLDSGGSLRKFTRCEADNTIVKGYIDIQDVEIECGTKWVLERNEWILNSSID